MRFCLFIIKDTILGDTIYERVIEFNNRYHLLPCKYYYYPKKKIGKELALEMLVESDYGYLENIEEAIKFFHYIYGGMVRLVQEYEILPN